MAIIIGKKCRAVRIWNVKNKKYIKGCAVTKQVLGKYDKQQITRVLGSSTTAQTQ